jgi:hypothetical protein
MLDLVFSAMEVSLFTNLKIGHDINSLIEDDFGIILEYIDKGKLRDAVALLEDVYRHQEEQLGRLNATNAFVRHASNSVATLRRESSKVKPDLASEEWFMGVKKTASGFGTVALPMVAAVGLPIAAVPAGLIGAAIVAMGYALTDSYRGAEQNTREVLLALSALDQVLYKTEEALSDHERTLVILKEDVHSVMTSVNRSQSRFRAVLHAKLVGSQEYSLLRKGVDRVVRDSAALNKRYIDAMNGLYAKIQARGAHGNTGMQPGTDQYILLTSDGQQKPRSQQSLPAPP